MLAYPNGSIILFKYLDENICMVHVLWIDAHIELNNSCAVSNVHPATKNSVTNLKNQWLTLDTKNMQVLGRSQEKYQSDITEVRKCID